MSEERIQVSIHADKDLMAWIDAEAQIERRSRTGQIEYFLQEARRVREHNRKVQIRMEPTPPRNQLNAVALTTEG